MLARKILLATGGQEDPADLFSPPAWLLLIKARAARSGLIRAYTHLTRISQMSPLIDAIDR
jgi:hypothetical protein